MNKLRKRVARALAVLSSAVLCLASWRARQGRKRTARQTPRPQAPREPCEERQPVRPAPDVVIGLYISQARYRAATGDSTGEKLGVAMFSANVYTGPIRSNENKLSGPRAANYRWN